jgi:hypothetical protein
MLNEKRRAGRGRCVPTFRPSLLREEFERGGRDVFDEEVVVVPFALVPSLSHGSDDGAVPEWRRFGIDSIYSEIGVALPHAVERFMG